MPHRPRRSEHCFAADRKTAGAAAAGRSIDTHAPSQVPKLPGSFPSLELPVALQHFKVLTFDVVGTLIDFERGMLDYLRAVAPTQAVSDEDFLPAYRRVRKSPEATWYPDDFE